MKDIFKRLAHKILPQEQRSRRLIFGIAKGARADIDFRYDSAFFFGRHEPMLFRHYRRLLRRGMTCFDIGSYRGWDALNLAHLTGTKTFSFDADPRFIDEARRFVKPSGLPIEFVEVILGDGNNGTQTLDSIAAKFGHPDFVKMDIEGAESQVLRNSIVVLSKRPPLIVETHSKQIEDECIMILRDANYHIEIVDRSSSHFFSEARGDSHNRWLVAT